VERAEHGAQRRLHPGVTLPVGHAFDALAPSVERAWLHHIGPRRDAAPVVRKRLLQARPSNLLTVSAQLEPFCWQY